jgi:hypothetical protein
MPQAPNMSHAHIMALLYVGKGPLEFMLSVWVQWILGDDTKLIATNWSSKKGRGETRIFSLRFRTPPVTGNWVTVHALGGTASRNARGVSRHPYIPQHAAQSKMMQTRDTSNLYPHFPVFDRLQKYTLKLHELPDNMSLVNIFIGEFICLRGNKEIVYKYCLKYYSSIFPDAEFNFSFIFKLNILLNIVLCCHQLKA